MDILALLQCLQPSLPATTLRQCSRIVRALLVMTGRITMLGMSRWAGKGGSYRTIQRFFAGALGDSYAPDFSCRSRVNT